MGNKPQNYYFIRTIGIYF